jgi:hypothetical protein
MIMSRNTLAGLILTLALVAIFVLYFSGVWPIHT